MNHASESIRKERLSPTSKARLVEYKFVEEGGVPGRVENFGEIDSSENHSRTRPGFVKPIRNGLRKEQNLV